MMTVFMLYLLVGLFTALSILCEARWTGSKSDYQRIYDQAIDVGSFRATWCNYTLTLFFVMWLWPAVYFLRWKDTH